MKIETQRFRYALALIVARPNARRIDVAAIGLLLRMLKRIAIDLATKEI